MKLLMLNKKDTKNYVKNESATKKIEYEIHF